MLFQDNPEGSVETLHRLNEIITEQEHENLAKNNQEGNKIL